MRKVILPASCFLLACLVGDASAALPIRKPDLTDAVVEKVVAATEAEKKEGVVVILFFKDSKKGVPIKKNTAIHRQMGKLVPLAEVGEILAGSRVSVWVDSRKGKAEGVLIFP